MAAFLSAIRNTYSLLIILLVANWCINVFLVGFPPLDLKHNVHVLTFSSFIYALILLWRMLTVSDHFGRALKKIEVALFSTHRIFWAIAAFSILTNTLMKGEFLRHLFSFEVWLGALIFYLPFLIWRLIKPKARKAAN